MNGLMMISGAFNFQIPGELFESTILILGEIFRSEARGMWALIQLHRGYIE